MIFAGASYFQAIARSQLFGMSARGLAIGTGGARGEEFPFFAPTGSRRRRVTGWWCTRCSTARAPPAPTFTVRPGEVTTIDVEATIFVRQEIVHLGLAP